jgi:hypothetical protein
MQKAINLSFLFSLPLKLMIGTLFFDYRIALIQLLLGCIRPEHAQHSFSGSSDI